jgi:L-cystine transport system substrate-binding protein
MKKALLILLTLVTIVVMVGGCAAKTSTTAQVRKVIVGTFGQIPNITFTDESGKLTGYDVEVVREIAKHVPGMEVEFQILDFPNLLLSLDTKKIDMATCLLEKNADRAAKYGFPSEAYIVMLDKLIVHQDNTTINSINDMAGKTLILAAGSNEQSIGENWNKAHGNVINITYSPNGPVDIVAQIKSGRADASIFTDFDVRNYNTQADAQWKTVGEPLAVAHSYEVTSKDDTQLMAMIDQGLKAMKADGTLAKLSVQWLGADYTQEPE